MLAHNFHLVKNCKPVMSSNTKALNAQRRKSTARSKPAPGTGSLALVVKCMKMHAPVKKFVPDLPKIKDLGNYKVAGGVQEGQATVLRTRRPLSAGFARKICGFYDIALANHPNLFEKEFVEGDQSAAEELRDAYILAGRPVPVSLDRRISELAKGKGSVLKREIRATVTPLVNSAQAIEDLDALSRDVFGVGVDVLAAPIFFLHANASTSPADCKALLEGDTSVPEVVEIEDPKDGRKAASASHWDEIFSMKKIKTEPGADGGRQGGALDQVPASASVVPASVPPRPGTYMQHPGYVQAGSTPGAHSHAGAAGFGGPTSFNSFVSPNGSFDSAVAKTSPPQFLPADRNQTCLCGGWVWVVSQQHWVYMG